VYGGYALYTLRTACKFNCVTPKIFKETPSPLKGAKHKIFVECLKSPLGDLGASLAVNAYLMTHPSPEAKYFNTFAMLNFWAKHQV